MQTYKSSINAVFIIHLIAISIHLTSPVNAHLFKKLIVRTLFLASLSYCCAKEPESAKHIFLKISVFRKYTMPLRCVAAKIGGPLQVITVQAPIPKEGEVLVRLKAVALNHVDWKQV